jgi:4-hydroxythreonine-4-phosphate dehydrogenase
MGEPAGIGGELTLRAWLTRERNALPVFLAVDDPVRLRRLAEALGWDIPIDVIAVPAEAPNVFPRALPVIPEPLTAPPRVGEPLAANAAAVLGAIRRAAALAQEGAVGAVVTNPIHKKTLYDAGFSYPGHTEFLAALTGAPAPVMMLCAKALRVVPVTVHLPLAEAVAALDTDAIVAAGKAAAESLSRDFGISRPRLAVAALNPHAGENGSLGREEIEIIAPAVERLRAAGIDAFGPAPADTLFHAEARTRYDAVLCMYHDQALIPLKTLDFCGGVNVTLGLPIVRTSPDHGTALNLAGKGIARPDSLIAAIRLAGEIARRRSA